MIRWVNMVTIWESYVYILVYVFFGEGPSLSAISLTVKVWSRDKTAMGDSLSMKVWEKDVLLQDNSNVAEIVSCQSSARFVLEPHFILRAEKIW